MLAKILAILVFFTGVQTLAQDYQIRLAHPQILGQRMLVPVTIDTRHGLKSVRLAVSYKREVLEFDPIQSVATPGNWRLYATPIPSASADSSSFWIILRGALDDTVAGGSSNLPIANLVFNFLGVHQPNLDAVVLEQTCEKTNWVVVRKNSITGQFGLADICGSELHFDQQLNVAIASPQLENQFATFPIIVNSSTPVKRVKMILDYDPASLAEPAVPIITLGRALRDKDFQLKINTNPALPPAPWAKQNVELELASATGQTFAGTGIEIVKAKFTWRDTLRLPKIDINRDCAAGFLEYLEASGKTQRICLNGKNSPALQVEEKNVSLPTAFNLFPSYPNPVVTGASSHGFATIRYVLPRAERVSIKIYDVLGKQVRTLVAQTLTAGYHHATWRGDNDHGVAVRTGIYFVRMQAAAFSQTKRVLLLR